MSVLDMIELVSCSGPPGSGPRVVSGGDRCPPEILEQLVMAHDGWTPALAPPAEQPVVSSFPLKSSSHAGPGSRHVVSVTWRDDSVRHLCCLVTEQEYSRFGFNPYRLLDGRGREVLPDEVRPTGFLGAGLNPDTSNLVVEGLQQLLVRGELHLPLSGPDSASDRILSCLLAAIPRQTRAGLRYTSFCPGEPWQWNLAAVHQPGGSLVDWKRRVLNLLEHDPGKAATAYFRSVTGRLGIGDIQGLEELARTTRYQPSLEAGRRTASPERTPMPESISMGRSPSASVAGGSHPAPVIKPAAPVSSGSLGGGVVSRSARKIVLERRRLRPIAMPDTHRTRRLPGKVISMFVFLAVMLGGWFLGGIPGLSVKSLAERLIPAWGNGAAPQEAALLTVVDVGQVYESVLTRYQNRILAGGGDADAARQGALDELGRGASQPLAGQVATYLDVVAGGIRQGSRPEREIRRLESLVAEGKDLTGDLVRLELAWFSLSERTCWQDVAALSDRDVKARCDSLSVVRPAWRIRAAEDLNISGLALHQRQAVVAAGAMGRLLALFQATSWSPQWQAQMQAAAENVPPAASPVTRAYRNSAFALVRLKEAEHRPAALGLPFGGGWSRGGWPSAEVRETLPVLRRTAGMFRQGQAPLVVASIVEIYALIAESGAAAVRAGADPGYWQDLNANPAVSFDPAVFEDVLGRLRFEALRPYLDRGDAPATWPAHLTTLAAAPGILQFYGMLATSKSNAGWAGFSGDVTDPFLNRWARHLATAYGAEARDQLVTFGEAWARMTTTASFVRSQAVAGNDWSGDWRNLQVATLDLLDRYVLAFGDNPVCRAQMAAAAHLLEAMNEPLNVHVTSATLKLEAIPPGADLVLEAVVMPQMTTVRTPVPVVESGRKVIPVPLDWNLEWGPASWVTFRVRNGGTGDVLLEVICPSLQEQAGPGALVRPLESEAGSVAVRIDAGVWRQLDLPDLAAIF